MILYDMWKEHLFVNIMMLLQVAAICNYMWRGSWWLVLYWVSCTCINFTVTYGLGR